MLFHIDLVFQVPLPFMSYGGSFAASLIVILTVVQRINYEENKKNRKKMA